MFTWSELFRKTLLLGDVAVMAAHRTDGEGLLASGAFTVAVVVVFGGLVLVLGYVVCS
jgi:hypothetical protein